MVSRYTARLLLRRLLSQLLFNWANRLTRWADQIQQPMDQVTPVTPSADLPVKSNDVELIDPEQEAVQWPKYKEDEIKLSATTRSSRDRILEDIAGAAAGYENTKSSGAERKEQVADKNTNYASTNYSSNSGQPTEVQANEESNNRLLSEDPGDRRMGKLVQTEINHQTQRRLGHQATGFSVDDGKAMASQLEQDESFSADIHSSPGQRENEFYVGDSAGQSVSTFDSTQTTVPADPARQDADTLSSYRGASEPLDEMQAQNELDNLKAVSADLFPEVETREADLSAPSDSYSGTEDTIYIDNHRPVDRNASVTAMAPKLTTGYSPENKSSGHTEKLSWPELPVDHKQNRVSTNTKKSSMQDRTMRWPDLPADPEPDNESFRVTYASAFRVTKHIEELDREQQGQLWNA